MNVKEVKVYSPATIANVTCGFDVLGMALNEPVEKMVLRKSHYPGVKICKIFGAELPLQYDKNVVGVVIDKILQHLPNNKLGIEVEIYKNIKPGSGLGSSGSSAAGAAVGTNFLLGTNFKPIEIIRFAQEGEKIACDSMHADNVAPAILGGISLVRSYCPLEVVSLPSPKKIWATIIHPHLEINTLEARKVLKPEIKRDIAIKQCGNVGALVSAFYREDNCLLSRSLVDYIAEPVRSPSIPEFDEMKRECKKVGALGGGISGSGPSVFMLSEAKDTAQKVANSMIKRYNKLKIDHNIYISTINNTGVKCMFK